MQSLLDMSNEALFTLLAAVAVPYVVATVNREMWPPLWKKAVQYLVCAIAAAGWLYATDNLDWHAWFRMALLVLVGSQIYFRLNRTAVDAVERATG